MEPAAPLAPASCFFVRRLFRRRLWAFNEPADDEADEGEYEIEQSRGCSQWHEEYIHGNRFHIPQDEE